MNKKTSPSFDHKLLTGQREDHLIPFADGPILIHREMNDALEKLALEALKAGFELKLASGFRSYERQLLIWNEKCTGKRKIENEAGEVIAIENLSPEEIVEAIMRWSALPGASRHHWGTDIDVFDALAVDENYKVQLSVSEVSEGGVFFAFHQWLDQLIADGKSFGFWRPYQRDLGGVAPEKWHLSYAPLSVPFYQGYDLDLFLKIIDNPELKFREIIARDAELIFESYVKRISLP